MSVIDLIRKNALGKLTLRLTVGVLTLFHGVAKAMNPGTVDSIGNRLAEIGLPSAIAYGVYLGEIVAPLMIVFGFFSRFGGLIVAGTMIVAIGLMHTGDFFALNEHGGWALELQAFYLLGALTILFLGSGKYAVKPD